MVPHSPSRPILITGAGGFVGQHLLTALDELLVPESHRVAIGLSAIGIEGVSKVYTGNIVDPKFVDETIHSLRPSAIIHLAAIAEPAKAFQDQKLGWSVNVEGSRNIASSILSHSSDTRLIFAGSAESYGESFNDYDGPVPESAALKPKNFYGATKAISDVLLGQLENDGLDVVRFRAFNHTGPDQTPAFVVPAFAEQIARIEAGQQSPVLKVGNLNAKRDFLDVRDVVRAYAKALSFVDRAPPARLYNISSGTARAISDILDGLLNLSDQKITIEQDPARMRASEVPVASGDSSALQRDFGWAPRISLEQTLKDTLDSYRCKFG